MHQRDFSFESTLEKEVATHSSILAWEIPLTEEPGGLQSMGPQRVRHDWATSLSFTFFVRPYGLWPSRSSVNLILQARTLEWVAIAFSNAWKWNVKEKSLSRVWLFGTPWTAAYQALPSMGFFQARVLEWGAIAFSLYFCSLSQICLILLPIFGLPLPFCCSTILIELAAFYHFLSVSRVSLSYSFWVHLLEINSLTFLHPPIPFIPEGYHNWV